MNTPRFLNYPHTVLKNEKKNCTTKNHIKAEHKKKTYFRNTKNKSKKLYSHEPSAYPQRINYPQIVAVFFKDVKTEETFNSQDKKLVETTNL